MDIVFSLDKLPSLVQNFWDAYGSRSIFALKGSMGAGKTTFVRALMDHLGVADQVSSPTYSIVNHYITSGGRDCYHLDLYRISGMEEALDLGMDELVDGNGICFIEWPEIVASLLPSDTVWLEFFTVNGNQRRLKVTEPG
jgi:tRNA threonylcarbamoyladenosine biosynthesis protein TsaE